MELSERFQKIIAYCEQIPMAQFERDRIKVQLDYFYLQSVCDLDRRDSPAVIAQNFKVLLQSKKVQNVLSKFRQQPRFWNEVATFVGDASYLRGTADRKHEVASVQEFFRHLVKLAQRMPESERVIKLVVRFGLQVLVLEAERPLLHRHPDEIEYVWRTIWPILERAGFLREFQADEVLKCKVKAFITCQAEVARERAAYSMLQHSGGNQDQAESRTQTAVTVQAQGHIHDKAQGKTQKDARADSPFETWSSTARGATSRPIK